MRIAVKTGECADGVESGFVGCCSDLLELRCGVVEILDCFLIGHRGGGR